VDIHHFLWFGSVMASLKSFLFGCAPFLGTTGAALYERQRALVNLGVLETTAGRGPGSGVPFTAENFAAILISLLAAESLSKVDEYVVDLCNAQPEGTLPLNEYRRLWESLGKPTFMSDFGRVLAGQQTVWKPFKGLVEAVRVTRPWRGQIVLGAPRRPLCYFPDDSDKFMVAKSISVTTEIEEEMLSKLIVFTKGALSQAAAEDDE
jgi:hypothetical protein